MCLYILTRIIFELVRFGRGLARPGALERRAEWEISTTANSNMGAGANRALLHPHPAGGERRKFWFCFPDVQKKRRCRAPLYGPPGHPPISLFGASGVINVNFAANHHKSPGCASWIISRPVAGAQRRRIIISPRFRPIHRHNKSGTSCSHSQILLMERTLLTFNF